MNVVVFGAGLSSTFLIQYLEENASEHNWNITVIDKNSSNIKERVKSKNTKTIIFDIHNEETLKNLIQNANLAISMLPARLHLLVANKCIQSGTHLATASYLSKEIKALDEDVKNKNLIFLNECGLDPGIDHLSAMKLINEIRDNSAVADGRYVGVGQQINLPTQLIGKPRAANPAGLARDGNLGAIEIAEGIGHRSV